MLVLRYKTSPPKDYLLVGKRDKNPTNMFISDSGKFYKEKKIGKFDRMVGVGTYFGSMLLKLPVVCDRTYSSFPHPTPNSLWTKTFIEYTINNLPQK